MLTRRYGAIFTQTDKAKVGALAGAQARNILLQSGLAQNILAQIWFVLSYTVPYLTRIVSW